MEVSDAKKLRELEDENRRLKRLLAEAELDKAAMKEVIELGPCAGSDYFDSFALRAGLPGRRSASVNLYRR